MNTRQHTHMYVRNFLMGLREQLDFPDILLHKRTYRENTGP